MKKILCFINIFSANANVYSHDPEKGEELLCRVSLETLANDLVDLSHSTNLNHITLIGSPRYSEAITSEILEYARTQYNMNDLIVEVMK